MTSKPFTGERVIDELKKCGVTHIVWLPDSEARFMYEAMMSQREITLVPICREGEAIAIAAGLILGGKKPLVLHQDSGFYESGDSVRGLGLNLKLPIVLLIGITHAGTFLEPMLNTWGIKHYLMETEEDVEKISTGYQEAQETNQPVAILIGGSMDRHD